MNEKSMSKEHIYLFDTTLRCPPCPQAHGAEDRQNQKTAVALATRW